MAVMAVIAGIFASQRWLMQPTAHGITATNEPLKDSLQATFHGTLLNEPRTIAPFSLTGIDHRPFNNERLRGQWTMVFFGFTTCGYLCPTTLAELGKMHRLLVERGVLPLPQVVMISIDPKRDSLVSLKRYVRAFDAHFYGARGTSAAINAIAAEWGIAYANIVRRPSAQSQDANDYDIEHTGTIILFNPAGKLMAFFTTPHHAEALADDYRQLMIHFNTMGALT